MKNWLFLLLLSALLPAYPAAAQDLTKLNLNWKYQPDAPLKLQWDLYQPADQAPSLLLQLKIAQPARTKSLSGFVHYRDSLNSATSLHREPLFSSIPKGAEEHQIQLNIDTTRAGQWLVLELQHSTDSLRSHWYPLHIPSLLHFGAPAFYLQHQEKPLLAPFALVESPITPRLTGNASDSLYLFIYQINFPPAPTPMTMAPNAAGTKMEIDERRLLTANSSITPDLEGFYFLQTDTLTLQGQGIRVENKYFPKTRTVPAMASPIRYLSTNEEWTELEREDFSKQAIDRFWLRMTQSEDKARKIIRSYYRRITQANILFTSFKEGWKTDMGMVYVLYGPPDVVRIRPDGEQWTYRAKTDIPEINFTFVRTVNPFDPQYFQLVRNKNYARTHFQIVSKWRRGQNLP